jgi:hypothetical protein
MATREAVRHLLYRNTRKTLWDGTRSILAHHSAADGRGGDCRDVLGYAGPSRPTTLEVSRAEPSR